MIPGSKAPKAIRGYQLGQNTFCPQHHINRTLIEEE